MAEKTRIKTQPGSKTKQSGQKSKKKDYKYPVSENILKYFRLVLLAAVLVVVFYPPYLRGLYFEDEVLSAEIFVFSVFILFWILKLVKRDKRFLETPVDYASFGLVIVYFLSIFVSVSTRMALAEWLKYCMYFAVFFMLSELTTTYKSKIAVLWVIVASGTGVAILGIDGASGERVAKLLNQFFKSLGVQQDLFFQLLYGGRASSTLQYPNTLGSYLMAVFFISLCLMIISSKLGVKMIAGVSGFILLLTFVFTFSRGAFLIFPLAALIFMLVLPKGSRIKGVAFAFAPLIPVALISFKLSTYLINPTGDEQRIWMYALWGTLGTAALTGIIHFAVKWLEKISWKVYISILAGVIAISAAALVFALNATLPLELSHPAGQPDSPVTVQKNVVLEPNREYRLVYKADASVSGDKPNAYTIDILNNTEKNILFGGNTNLAAYQGKQTNGTEERQLAFRLPQESKIVNIVFTNTYQDTKATISNARIVDGATGKTVKNLVLRYKYIPSFLSAMFEGLQANYSTLSRAVFYRDGLKIFKDHWVIGAGGGAWPLLYYAYQSYQYWSSQAHNYVLQLGIETGIVGLAVFILLLASVLLMLILEYRNKRENDVRERILQAAVFTAITALVAHSLIDFDLSLSAVFLLLWELIALFNSRYRNKTGTEVIEHKTLFVNKFLEKLDALRRVRYLKLYPAIGLAAAVVFIIFPILFVTAKGYAAQAAKMPQSSRGREIAAEYMKKAVGTDGFNPVYRMQYANLLIQKGNVSQNDLRIAREQADTALALAKHDYDYYEGNKRVNILPRLAQFYFAAGDAENGLKAADLATAARPLLPDMWQIRVNAYYEVIKYYVQKKDNTNASKYIDRALAMIGEARTINQGNMNPFKFSDSTYEMLEKAAYAKENIGKPDFASMNNMVFCSIPAADVDINGIPDQWSVYNNVDYIKIAASGGLIRADNISADKEGYIRSRNLSLKPGTAYRIELELSNSTGIESIPYFIEGVTAQPEQLKLSGGLYTAEVTTPADFTPGTNALLLGVKGSYEIRIVRVVEK
ncbi:MAG: O-antigen ligase family protein [Clostridiales bacterium]|nr:O-antigen ligase family protein [Eubacteriales bacterium]MDH7567789.1 O-antigen ligase family protein [Clostridiales bacterium]